MAIVIIPPPTLAGGGDVTGGGDLNNANRVVTVAGTAEVGESDVSLSSGVFSRAGTLGLSATGANVLTFSTNGSERGRFSNAGNFGLGTNNPVNKLQLDIGTLSVSGYDGIVIKDDIETYWNLIRKDGSGNRRISIFSGTGIPLTLQESSGNVLIGTTTDDAGKVKITQTAGSTYLGLEHIGNQVWRHGITTDNTSSYVISNDTGGTAATKILTLTNLGNVLLGGVTSGGYRLDVQSSGSTGTMRVYDQTATTGVSTLVVRAGAGQSTNALQTWQNNAGTALAYVAATGNIVAKELRALDTTANIGVYADSGTGTNYYLSSLGLQHGSSTRWLLYKTSDSAGDFALSRHDDAGAYVGAPITITRANGYVSLVESGARIGFFGVTPVARQTATADAASILALLQAYGLSN